MLNKATDILQSKWRSGKCPIMSGVIRSQGDGDVLPVVLKLSTQNDSPSAELEKRSLASLGSWIDLPSSEWTIYGPLYEIRNHLTNLQISCGELASNGSQGFVASSRINDDALYWIAIFPNSNPFSKCELTDGRVVAHSTIGLSVAIALDDPHDIVIV